MSPFHLYVPQLFPGDQRLINRLLFAPFWVDVDIRREGRIWYGSHLKERTSVTRLTDELIHELSPEHSDFTSEAVFVVTWESVPNYPDGSIFFNDEKSDLRNTFQAAIITNFTNTFMTYSYIDIQFSGRRNAVVGYTAGDGKSFFNQPGSQTDDIGKIDEVKTGNYTGLLFFHLTSIMAENSEADFLCRNWYYEDKKRFGDIERLQFSFTPCPWTSLHAARDRRYKEVRSDKGECYIGLFPRQVFLGGEVLRVETECCYQSRSLNLGSPFGGSISPYHRLSSADEYIKLTALPYDWCCRQSSNCHLYFERRPSRSSWFYWPPGWGMYCCVLFFLLC